MKYLWYGFLGLFSIGFIGAVVAVGGFIYIVNYYNKDLPDFEQLRNYEPPIVTRLYAGDGRLLAEFAQEKRVFVPIEFIPDRVKQAFIATEDQNFYEHNGVDLAAVTRAMIKNIKNKLMGSDRRPEGASTITQQVAKNFFFSSEVNYERKIKEAIIAYRMSQTLSKDRILELYLNEIFLGGGAYGVAAAAQHYFDKSLEELDIAEVAYLAALPKAPNNYHPVKNHDAALERRNQVIDRMKDEGYITAAQADLAKLVPLKMVDRPEDESVYAPYFAEEVRRELAQRYGEDSLYKGGLAVKTSIDPRLQKIALTSMREGLMAYDKRHGWRGPVATLESMDGWRLKLADIKRQEGMVPIWDYAVVLETSKDQATLGFVKDQQGVLNLADAKWARKYLNEGYAQGPEVTSMAKLLSVGDVIMVEKKTDKSKDDEAKEAQTSDVEAEAPKQAYVLRQVPIVQGALIAMDPHTGRVLAMQGGWNYRYGVSEFNRATQAQRQPGSSFKPFIYLAALDKGFTPATLIMDAPFVLTDPVTGKVWKPTNYSKNFGGPTTLREGIEKSKNLMTVRLANYIGMDLVSKYAEHFGIADKMPPYLSNALGAQETTVIRMTNAYAMLVNGGKKVTPTFIDRVQDRHGKTVFKHDARACQQCGDMIKWEGQAVPEVPDDREQIADARTTYQMVSIMEGVVQRGTATKLKSLGRPLAGKTGTTNESRDTWFIGFSPDLVVGVFVGFDDPRSLGKKETGGSVSVPIFKSFMEEALKDVPPVPFRRPPGLKSVQINAKTGTRAYSSAEGRVIWENFIPGTEPTDEVYILNDNGVSSTTAMSSEGEDYYGGYGVSNGTGDAYVPNAPVRQAAPVNTGTGGLY